MAAQGTLQQAIQAIMAVRSPLCPPLFHAAVAKHGVDHVFGLIPVGLVHFQFVERPVSGLQFYQRVFLLNR